MAEFKPTHRLRERGTETWTEVRADGNEPQTYYDREGKTIYAGIWFQHMEVERLNPAEFRKQQLMVTALSRSLTETERLELVSLLSTPAVPEKEADQ